MISKGIHCSLHLPFILTDQKVCWQTQSWYYWKWDPEQLNLAVRVNVGCSNHNFKFSEAIIHLYIFLRWKLLNATKSGKDKKKKTPQCLSKWCSHSLLFHRSSAPEIVNSHPRPTWEISPEFKVNWIIRRIEESKPDFLNIDSTFKFLKVGRLFYFQQTLAQIHSRHTRSGYCIDSACPSIGVFRTAVMF